MRDYTHLTLRDLLAFKPALDVPPEPTPPPAPLPIPPPLALRRPLSPSAAVDVPVAAVARATGLLLERRRTATTAARAGLASGRVSSRGVCAAATKAGRADLSGLLGGHCRPKPWGTDRIASLSRRTCAERATAPCVRGLNAD